MAGTLINGHATIGAVRDLGVIADGQRLCELDLSIRPDGQAAYPLTQRLMIPSAQAGRVVVGASLPVHIQATNPSLVAVDWNGS